MKVSNKLTGLSFVLNQIFGNPTNLTQNIKNKKSSILETVCSTN